MQERSRVGKVSWGAVAFSQTRPWERERERETTGQEREQSGDTWEGGGRKMEALLGHPIPSHLKVTDMRLCFKLGYHSVSQLKSGLVGSSLPTTLQSLLAKKKKKFHLNGVMRVALGTEMTPHGSLGHSIALWNCGFDCSCPGGVAWAQLSLTLLPDLTPQPN